MIEIMRLGDVRLTHKVFEANPVLARNSEEFLSMDLSSLAGFLQEKGLPGPKSRPILWIARCFIKSPLPLFQALMVILATKAGSDIGIICSSVVFLCFVDGDIKLGMIASIPNKRQYFGIPLRRRTLTPMSRYVECNKPYGIGGVDIFSGNLLLSKVACRAGGCYVPCHHE